ncbi:hypothetical protein GSI_08132 [Ganoderma sinense ZZ0214-1]|uniref:Uncharacterized protein n=1 Tax=Ganoderma sinense ZZ0214-1 TaxID=1077348 RepID=A0A2G8S7I0_9APHY|nr:hypothetical protein GSI_08132 [Ganoderma sinense ZZ0214-1]
MPDDQLGSHPLENEAPGSATPDISLLASLFGPKPEPNVIDTRTAWPVPHIMVRCGEIEFACGRQAIVGMGKVGFLEWMYQKFMWKPQRKYDVYKTFYFESSRYSKEAKVLGTFHDVHGASDMGPVVLSELGWAEMMENVVKLEVVYDENLKSEGQGQPLKQG